MFNFKAKGRVIVEEKIYHTHMSKIIFLFMMISGVAMGISDNDRIIILSGKGIPQAKERLLQFKSELNERDVRIDEKPSQEKFKIELIGKDGGKKWEDGAEFKVSEILKKIDSMPMRQEEMRTRD